MAATTSTTRMMLLTRKLQWSPSPSSSLVKRSLSYSLQSVGRAGNSGSTTTTTTRHASSRPSYQVYSDDVSFSIKSMAPEFRAVGASGSTVVLEKKGRLMFEWVPKTTLTTAGAPRNYNNNNNNNNNNFGTARFAWDKPLRFAMSPEEVGLVLARIRQGQSVEIHRRGGFGGAPPTTSTTTTIQQQHVPLKVLRVAPLPGGGMRIVCDYELDGHGGQEPPEPHESQGPLGIDLMVGETQVVQSIMDYSLPRLSGWATLLDHSMEHAFVEATTVTNPHNYGGGGGGGGRSDGGVPF
jgi:Whirly transcription factor